MSPTGFPSSSTTARRPRWISSGKKVLEVSCGHGGGASYLVRTLDPASYTGLDLNSAGHRLFAEKGTNLPGLDFVQGNAENLPFPDQSFDAVINIEASHLLPSVSPFPRAKSRACCAREGHFLYADIRRRDGVAKWNEDLGRRPHAAHVGESHQRGGCARGAEDCAAVAEGDVSRCSGVLRR